MSLRLKLLLISLLTLALPWAGCHYAREMESVLREGEKQSLGAVAQTIASSLQGRGELLYRAPTAAFADIGPYDLQPVPLPGQPFVDGYGDEWPQEAPAAPAAGSYGPGEYGSKATRTDTPAPEPRRWKYFDQPPDRLGILTGVHERMLYVLLDVRDDKLVFDGSTSDPLDPRSLGDRVWVGFEDSEGAERQVFLSATGAGAVRSRRRLAIPARVQ